MARDIKQKEIQVQKPAQSLQAFQQKLATQPQESATLLKPVAITTCSLILVAGAFFGFQTWRQGRIERHEAAISELQQAIQGDGVQPLPALEMEKRMRERLPALETLAQNAPGPCQEDTRRLLATWKLQLEGKGGVTGSTGNPWERLALAQRQIGLAQSAEAEQTLAPLRAKADAEVAWAAPYWSTLMDLHRLKGDREQAWKDYAEYKRRFKDRADTGTMERLLAAI